MNKNTTISELKKTPCWKMNKHLIEDKLVKKRAKYNNVKVKFDNISFDSLKERDRYICLRMLQTSGEIKDLLHHVIFRLESKESKICDYEADFTYKIVKTGEMVVEDVKSKITRRLATYMLKKKLMMSCFSIEIKEV